MLPTIDSVTTIQFTAIEQFDLERFLQVENSGIQPPEKIEGADSLTAYIQTGLEVNTLLDFPGNNRIRNCVLIISWP